jgi:SRSO17 transposase
MEGLATAAGHQDRQEPWKSYCQGLLLPGERKSIEPMAARLTPDNVQRMRQSLHHLVAKAPWSDEGLLRQVRNSVLPAMRRQGPVVAWIVDDTGFPKKGRPAVRNPQPTHSRPVSCVAEADIDAADQPERNPQKGH